MKFFHSLIFNTNHLPPNTWLLHAVVVEFLHLSVSSISCLVSAMRLSVSWGSSGFTRLERYAVDIGSASPNSLTGNISPVWAVPLQVPRCHYELSSNCRKIHTENSRGSTRCVRLLCSYCRTGSLYQPGDRCENDVIKDFPRPQKAWDSSFLSN